MSRGGLEAMWQHRVRGRALCPSADAKTCYRHLLTFSNSRTLKETEVVWKNPRCCIGNIRVARGMVKGRSSVVFQPVKRAQRSAVRQIVQVQPAHGANEDEGAEMQT